MRKSAISMYSPAPVLRSTMRSPASTPAPAPVARTMRSASAIISRPPQRPFKHTKKRLILKRFSLAESGVFCCMNRVFQHLAPRGAIQRIPDHDRIGVPPHLPGLGSCVDAAAVKELRLRQMAGHIGNEGGIAVGAAVFQ